MCAKYKFIGSACIVSGKSHGLEQSFVKREILYSCEAKSVWQLPNLIKEVRAVPTSGSVRRGVGTQMESQREFPPGVFALQN